MRKRTNDLLILLGLLTLLGMAHAAAYKPSEPFFNNDETRHVMTGVFFHDFLHDMGMVHPHRYAVNYYLQYPALGLLVWPPFFYVVEGIFMLIFGTSFLAAKILVGIFAAISCVFLFRLVAWTHDTPRAWLAALVFGFSPLVFSFSRLVMLEIPTLACALAATYYLARYLEDGRRYELVLAALASVFAALTRFDGVYILPLFFVLFWAWKRFAVLRRKEVIFCGLLAALMVLPVYWLTYRGFGWVHSLYIGGDPNSEAASTFSLENLAFYPGVIPRQLGWFAFFPSVAGLLSNLIRARRAKAWPYLAMVIATYLAFTPMGDRGPRHAIYWVPAFSFFAADAVLLFADWTGKRKLLRAAFAAVVLAGTAWTTLRIPAQFVFGYEEAAKYALANTQSSQFCIVDAAQNGDFIYQVRRHDPARRLWVLRADKILYGVASDPRISYVEFAKTDDEILANIFKYDPELILVEWPRMPSQLPAADRLRAVLANHSERFQLVRMIPVQSNVPMFGRMQVAIYRNTLRNPHPERRLDVQMLGLRETFKTELPSKGSEPTQK